MTPVLDGLRSAEETGMVAEESEVDTKVVDGEVEIDMVFPGSFIQEFC